MMPSAPSPPPDPEAWADPKADDPDLWHWLVTRGVAARAAHRFVQVTRCETLHDAALYLRFELAPLQLANSDSVNGDMRGLLGCGAHVARRVICDLDVFRAAPLMITLLLSNALCEHK